MREGSYLPPMGLEAAMTVQRAWREVTMPALEMEMLCCSMASWMLVLSASFIWNRHGTHVTTITAMNTTLILCCSMDAGSVGVVHLEQA